ncbi:hypothetical protein Bca101_029925 [Brassica carinata]
MLESKHVFSDSYYVNVSNLYQNNKKEKKRNRKDMGNYEYCSIRFLSEAKDIDGSGFVEILKFLAVHYSDY